MTARQRAAAMQRGSAPQPLLASAPGKLVLLGEYAVLAGAPALVTAVERRARVILRPVACPRAGAGGRFSVRAPEVGVHEATFTIGSEGRLCFDAEQTTPAGLRVMQTLLTYAWQRSVQQGAVPWPLTIDIDSSQLFGAPDAAPAQKLGLGSSAAVAVSLLLGLADAWGLQLDEGEDTQGRGGVAAPARERAMLSLACRLHRQAQGGTGSGIDVAAALLGGLLRYQLSDGLPDARALRWPPGLAMLPVWSGQPACTPALVAAVGRFAQQRPRAHAKLMASMADVSSEGLAALAAGAVESFTGAVDAYGALLAELGRLSGAPIMTPEHAAIAACVRAHGAAYKPSGAGGGDLGVALWAGQQDEGQVRLQSALDRAGFQAVPLRPAVLGGKAEPITG